MTEHHPRDQRAPHRAHRIVVSSPPALGLQRRHQLRIGQRVQDQLQAAQLRQPLDIGPGEEYVVRRRHGASSTGPGAGSLAQTIVPDGDAYFHFICLI